MSDTPLLVLAREFSKLRAETKKVLALPVGPQGETGPQGVKGEKGDRGDNGKDGKQGRDGVDGRDGKTGPKGDKGDTGPMGRQGVQGVSVVNAEIDFDGRLRIELSNGNIVDAGEIPTGDAVGSVHVSGNAWQITVSNAAPTDPQLNQLWFDIS